MSSIELGMTDYRLKAAAVRLEDLHRYHSLDPAAAADAAFSDQIVVHTCVACPCVAVSLVVPLLGPAVAWAPRAPETR